VEVDDGGLVRPGARRRGAGEQKLLDTVQCHLLQDRGAEGGRPLIDQPQQNRELQSLLHAGWLSACSGNQKWVSRVLTVTPENGTPSLG